jgi:hypothetical protein
MSGFSHPNYSIEYIMKEHVPNLSWAIEEKAISSSKNRLNLSIQNFDEQLLMRSWPFYIKKILMPVRLQNHNSCFYLNKWKSLCKNTCLFLSFNNIHKEINAWNMQWFFYFVINISNWAKYHEKNLFIYHFVHSYCSQ